VQTYKISYAVQDITGASDGNLVVVETANNKQRIVNPQGETLRELTVPKTHQYARTCTVARYGQVLFIGDCVKPTVHVLNEDNTYIKELQTDSRIKTLSVQGNTLWVATASKFHTYTINSDYSLISTGQRELGYALRFAVSADRFAYVSYTPQKMTFQVYDHEGSLIFPAVDWKSIRGGGLFDTADIIIDEVGRTLVADRKNKGVALISETGEFVKYVVSQSDGLSSEPSQMFLRGSQLFLTTNSLLYKIHVQLK
jgi:hypothetical protein